MCVCVCVCVCLLACMFQHRLLCVAVISRCRGFVPGTRWLFCSPRSYIYMLTLRSPSSPIPHPTYGNIKQYYRQTGIILQAHSQSALNDCGACCPQASDLHALRRFGLLSGCGAQNNRFYCYSSSIDRIRVGMIWC